MANYPYNQYGMMQPVPQQPMQQMYNPQPQQMQPAPTYTCMPVTSREEAIASSTNYLGLGNLMPDIAHEVIYLKRFNRDTGVSDFFEFRRCPETQKPVQTEYVTRTAFDETINSLMEELNALKKRGTRKAADGE